MPFSKNSIEFLIRNKLENSKEFYNSHKDEFKKKVINPFVEFVDNIRPYLNEIDPKIKTEAKTDKCISRVYRDTRFSNDKSLYRDVMWCIFSENKNSPELPAFFLEISPEGFRYGCGWYWMPTALAKAMREIILEKNKAFSIANKVYEKSGFELVGEKYKKSSFPEYPENEKNWLDRKCVSVLKNNTDSKLLFSDRLADVIGKEFLQLKEIYRFFIKIGNKYRENMVNSRQNFDF